MLREFKRILYFPIAWYFRFFASIKLARWKPRVVVITGSNGKTTLMNLVVSQLKHEAAYSHHANSSFGIPFNILGLERKTLNKTEWIGLFLLAPFKTFSKTSSKKIYIVEADCDRPGEGKFLSSLLQPEVTIWLSSSRSHSMNFDRLVALKKFKNVDEAIAFEYGYFIENTSKLVIVNKNSSLILDQLGRTKAQNFQISDKDLEKYEVTTKGTLYKIMNREFKFKYLLPQAVFSSVEASIGVAKYFNLPADESFSGFEIPPGRSSIFKGIKNTIIVDSSYNSNLSSASQIIKMFNQININKKWVVICDMLEQGKEEREEHEKLAKLIADGDYDMVILLGSKLIQYSLGLLKEKYQDKVISFTSPKDTLSYIKVNTKGGEIILFKGGRYSEGIIEHLLLDKSDIDKLSRREKIWQARRKKKGL